MKNIILPLIKKQCDILISNTELCGNAAVNAHSVLNHVDTTPCSLSYDHHPMVNYTGYSIGDVLAGNTKLGPLSKAILTKTLFDTLSTEAKKRLPKELSIVTEDHVEPPPRPFGGRKIWSTIERVFSDPKKFSDLFIDSLEFTIDLEQKQSDELILLLEDWAKNSWHVRKRKVTDAKEVGYRNKFVIKDGGDSCITVFIDPFAIGETCKEKRKGGNYTRLIKFSFNPEKANQGHIDHLLNLTEEASGLDYQELMNTAVVTRYDITIDIEGIYPAEFICRKKGVSIIKRYISKNGQLMTIIEGANGYDRTCIYNKREEMIHKAMERGNVEEAQRLRTLGPITRVEITYRPYKNKKTAGTTFETLYKLKSPFECLEIYDGSKLYDLPILQPHLSYIKQNGLNSLRIQLSKAEWKKMKRDLRKAQITINHRALFSRQCRKFRTLKFYLISGGRSQIFR